MFTFGGVHISGVGRRRVVVMVMMVKMAILLAKSFGYRRGSCGFPSQNVDFLLKN